METWHTYSAPSPNFNPTPVAGKSVVIHSTRSGHFANPSELTATIGWFTQPGTVSAHLVIDRDGSIWRCVDDNKQAWHAREWNAISWGIELCQSTLNEPFTEAQYASLRAAAKHYHDEFGVPLVHATRDSIEGFIGHEEVPPGLRDGKTDPGPKFEWSKLLAMPEETPEHIEQTFNGKQTILWHHDVAILRIGDVAGEFPGRLAKLFGERYLWLRKADDGTAFWSEEEGD